MANKTFFFRSIITGTIVVIFIAARVEFIGIPSQNNFRSYLLGLALVIPSILVFFDHLFKPSLSRKNFSLLVAFFPLIAVYMGWFFFSIQKGPAISAVLRLCLLLLWVMFIMKAAQKGRCLFLIQIIMLIVIGASLTSWIIEGMNFPMTGLFQKKNTIAYMALLATFFLIQVPEGLPKPLFLINRLSCYLGIILSVIISLLTSSRVAFVSYFIILCFYWAWPLFTRTFFRYKMIFIMMIVAIAITTTFIAALNSITMFNDGVKVLTEGISNYSGRNINSGRNIIWPNLLLSISEKPLLGRGPQVEPSSAFADTSARANEEWSAHSSYLQIGFQTGLVGLISFCFLLYKIWFLFFQERHNPKVRLGGTYFLIILIIQTFTVSLTEQNLTLGVIMWTIIAFTLAQTNSAIALVLKEKKAGLIDATLIVLDLR